jgi:hypothetical protein
MFSRGPSKDAAGIQHGFVRNPYGTATSFDPPEDNQTLATSISDGGTIAGFFHYLAGGDPPGGLYPCSIGGPAELWLVEKSSLGLVLVYRTLTRVCDHEI